jgi:uncharacterized membrane protein
LLAARSSSHTGCWSFSPRRYHHHHHHLSRTGVIPAFQTTKSRVVSQSSPSSLLALNHLSSGAGSTILSSFQLPTQETINVASVAIGFGILCGYHVKLIFQEKQGGKTWRSVQADMREKWSQYVRETEGWLYAIQTMRNAITSMTFLSTTVLSLLTVITGRLWEVIRSCNHPRGDPSGQKLLLMAQFAIVASCMLTSAYQFLQSARLMTHAGFMFPVERKGTTKVDRVMRKSQNAQWMGLRWLYLSLGVISWIVGGPQVFLAAAVLLSIFFRNIDKVPKGLDSDQVYE